MHIANGDVSKVLFLSIVVVALCIGHSVQAEVFDRDNIPLPEHPRPDFERAQWINLNGPWDFGFDAENEGQKQEWFKGKVDFNKTIMVPFPWGSKLSGVKDEADIGWYGRDINVPDSWQPSRVFLVVGACDWHTTAWLDGNLLGEYQGGYTPFELELTLERTLRLEDSVLRYLTIQVADQVPDIEARKAEAAELERVRAEKAAERAAREAEEASRAAAEEASRAAAAESERATAAESSFATWSCPSKSTSFGLGLTQPEARV